ncbi:hypothetical protein HMPREF0670_01748 [Prevotella sp. oral taxon 317 str. F0108]|nr:hypothetical protein HMPREF0670_01748 [Prevotella sp. oral taxon 317 str. F0108]
MHIIIYSIWWDDNPYAAHIESGHDGLNPQTNKPTQGYGQHQERFCSTPASG